MNYLSLIEKYLHTPLFKLGTTPFTLWSFLYIFILFGLLLIVTNRVKHWFISKMANKPDVNIGSKESIASLLRYSILTFGFVVILQSAGIDLSTLTVLAGALGIGVGFGLQNIISNMFSGLIILFERPIKIGDRIEIGGVRGDIVNINLRSTELITNDNIVMIIPNSEFTNTPITNLSYNDNNVRLSVAVGVSYDSDIEKVKTTLLEIASKNDGVLSQPPPLVLLDSFGDNSLNFILSVWTSSFTNKPALLRSSLNYEILRRFREEKISIPFPQRDIHIIT